MHMYINRNTVPDILKHVHTSQGLSHVHKKLHTSSIHVQTHTITCTCTYMYTVHTVVYGTNEMAAEFLIRYMYVHILHVHTYVRV